MYEISQINLSESVPRKIITYISGYPIGHREIFVSYGEPFAISRAWMESGYRLIYTNLTAAGMSGGPIFNSKGELIGIHGRAQEHEIHQNLSSLTLKSAFNYGMPIFYYGYLEIYEICQPLITIKKCLSASSQQIISAQAMQYCRQIDS